MVGNRTCNFKFKVIDPSEYLRKTSIFKITFWESVTFVFLKFEIKRRNEVSVFEGSIDTLRKTRGQLRTIV